MTEDSFFTDLPKGWGIYQQLLIDAVRPLTAQQLTLQVGHDLRPAGRIAAHIIAARVRWLRQVLAEGSQDLDRWADLDREWTPIPSGEELAQALEVSWQPLRYATGRDAAPQGWAGALETRRLPAHLHHRGGRPEGNSHPGMGGLAPDRA